MQVLDRHKSANLKVEKEMLRKLSKVQQEYAWLTDNSESLKRTHLNKYVAVKDKKVAYYSDDFEALLKVLLASKADPDSFAVKKVTKDAACLLL